MMKRKLAGWCMAAAMAFSLLAGCGASEETAADTAGSSAAADAGAGETSSAEDSGNVLRVGMECAYPPFNWTQMTSEVADGITAEPIYGTDTYAYGYDVAVAQMLARELGMDLEIHKVEWSSIGTSLDAGVYDAVIAGMGRTPEREMAYAFTEPYYYRHNCIVVKKGGDYENVTKLSDLADTGCRVTTQLGPDGYLFWSRSRGRSCPEITRRPPNVSWLSPTEWRTSVWWIFPRRNPRP